MESNCYCCIKEFKVALVTIACCTDVMQYQTSDLHSQISDGRGGCCGVRRGVRAEDAGERREEGHLHRGRQLEVRREPEPVPRVQRSADVGLFMNNLI